METERSQAWTRFGRLDLVGRAPNIAPRSGSLLPCSANKGKRRDPVRFTCITLCKDLARYGRALMTHFYAIIFNLTSAGSAPECCQ